MAAQIDVVACPPERRTFNPDGSRIRPQTPEEAAAEEEVFEKGRKRWGDRVGRRPTPPPASVQPTASVSTGNSNADTTSLDSDATLLPGQQSKRKSGLLARVFGRDNEKKGGEKKEKERDQYIAAAASWDGEGGKGDRVRRERLGRRD
ncbi:MAG: hypothetical protein OHK93_001244 [Ramalina farinacea]|uniref:Uncharacterized protein n=1 Tax=Ramalina farinacea TaxID=258253 RepID=A0AA43QP54_9LECA|nr:hypothetical protein [Ramalina farinacea]